MKVAVFSMFLVMGAAGVGYAGDAEPGMEAEIIDLLDNQVRDWNRGELEGFMAGYWESDDLVFTSGGRVTRGWATTLGQYRETYGGGKESMGTLSFEEVEVFSLGPEAAWVLGRWQLEREGKSSGGVFTLVLRNISGRWRIVHDHTSVDE